MFYPVCTIIDFSTHVSNIDLLEEQEIYWTLLLGKVDTVGELSIYPVILPYSPTLQQEKYNLMSVYQGAVIIPELSSMSYCMLQVSSTHIKGPTDEDVEAINMMYQNYWANFGPKYFFVTDRRTEIYVEVFTNKTTHF